jgi:hypothetical protein
MQIGDHAGRVQQVGWHVGSFQGDEVAGVRHLSEFGAGE